MKLAVILVNYNGKKYNTACIESILANVGMEELKIVVVDNASQDASMRLLEEQFDKESYKIVATGTGGELLRDEAVKKAYLGG